ncbi:diguanylate cyclase domain-containing protein [Streptomyces anulatus]|uniref:diguanylate cyclase domain-containing protein n=1 Tax=Streptomyces anulatus TaxID=1892 RepID=UPI00362670E1
MNDTMGHAAGDTVLAAYGGRLTAWAGPRAAVGRLGGDEFALVLELNADRRERCLEQLFRMLHTPVVLDDGRTVDVAASVGAATPDVLGARDLSRL